MESFVIGLSQLTDPVNLLFVLFGSMVGLVFGVIPGLSGVTAMILALPFTFGMNPISAMYLFTGFMGAQAFGGSVTAILINVPGTACNAATCFDGYPMAQKGEAGKALGISAFASAFGAIFGLVILVALLPVARILVMSLGPPEFFMLIVFGLICVSLASQADIMKGLVGAGIGILISLIGHSSVHGVLRFHFGMRNYLFDGVYLTSFILGVFLFSIALEHVVKGGSVAAAGITVKPRLRDALDGAKEVIRSWANLLRSSTVGVLIGIIPGIGGLLANFLSYLIAMRTSKHPETFGTGNPEGVVASESGNDAKDGGALFPTLAFGIPGSVEMAVFMGVLLFLGLDPGPFFIREHMDVVWAIILGMVVSNILASSIGLLVAGWAARLTTIPTKIIVPFIVATGFIGIYSARGEVWDVLAAIIYGFFAYGLVRFGFPRITLVMGYILGPLAEKYFFQSLGITWGDPMVFFTRPISLALVIVAIGLLLMPIVVNMRLRRAK
ncbi:tripartite tricarboxylate transporter permease [Chloroflexota bacterium]